MGKIPSKCGEGASIVATSLDLILNDVIAKTAMRLSDAGFRKNGSTFRRLFDAGAALIEFQKSRGNTKDVLSFTINLAVVCGPLLEPDGLTLQKARAIDGHLRERIGVLLPDRQDKWWEIDATTDANALADEVANTTGDIAVPYLLRYVDPHDLMALWETGRAPGLTEGARARDLEMLKIALERI
jgi:hypothetical protein